MAGPLQDDLSCHLVTARPAALPVLSGDVGVGMNTPPLPLPTSSKSLWLQAYVESSLCQLSTPRRWHLPARATLVYTTDVTFACYKWGVKEVWWGRRQLLDCPDGTDPDFT